MAASVLARRFGKPLSAAASFAQHGGSILRDFLSSLDDALHTDRRTPSIGDEAVHSAIEGGWHADRLGFAFIAGYRAASAIMFGAWLPPRTSTASRLPLVAFAASEGQGGAHPRSIQTKLSPQLTLTGAKSFITGGNGADLLAVVALDERQSGARRDPPNLCVALVDPRAQGLSISPATPLAIVPEIPHAQAVMDGAAVLRVLPGDGYERFLKPFRFVEDSAVNLALASHLTRVCAEHELQLPELGDRLSLAAHFFASVLRADEACWRDPAHHVLFGSAAGVLREAVSAVEASWALRGGEAWQRWTRDRALLQVAGKARAARLAKALASEL